MNAGRERTPTQPIYSKTILSPELRKLIKDLAATRDLIYFDKDVFSCDVQYLIDFARAIERELTIRETKK